MTPYPEQLAAVAELVAAALLVVGALFVFIGSLGLFRLGDFYSRLHGPSKSTTLGLGAILAGSALFFSARGTISLHEALITFFLFITAPVSAHLLAKAGLHLGLGAGKAAPGAEGGTGKGGEGRAG